MDLVIHRVLTESAAPGGAGLACPHCVLAGAIEAPGSQGGPVGRRAAIAVATLEAGGMAP